MYLMRADSITDVLQFSRCPASYLLGALTDERDTGERLQRAQEALAQDPIHRALTEYLADDPDIIELYPLAIPDEQTEVAVAVSHLARRTDGTWDIYETTTNETPGYYGLMRAGMACLAFENMGLEINRSLLIGVDRSVRAVRQPTYRA